MFLDNLGYYVTRAFQRLTLFAFEKPGTLLVIFVVVFVGFMTYLGFKKARR